MNSQKNACNSDLLIQTLLTQKSFLLSSANEFERNTFLKKNLGTIICVCVVKYNPFCLHLSELNTLLLIDGALW